MPDSLRSHDFPFHAFSTMCIRSSKIKNLLRLPLCACRSALAALKRALSGREEIASSSPKELANEDARPISRARSEGEPSKPSTRVLYYRTLPTSPRVKYYSKHISHCII